MFPALHGMPVEKSRDCSPFLSRERDSTQQQNSRAQPVISLGTTALGGVVDRVQAQVLRGLSQLLFNAKKLVVLRNAIRPAG